MSANSGNGGVRYVGVSFTSLLTILLIGLKLTGYIDWSWWLVLLPMIVSALVTVVVIIVGIILIVRGT